MGHYSDLWNYGAWPLPFPITAAANEWV